MKIQQNQILKKLQFFLVIKNSRQAMLPIVASKSITKSGQDNASSLYSITENF